MSKKAFRLESLAIDSGREEKTKKNHSSPTQYPFFPKMSVYPIILISYLQDPKTYIMPLIFAYCNFKGFFQIMFYTPHINTKTSL